MEILQGASRRGGGAHQASQATLDRPAPPGCWSPGCCHPVDSPERVCEDDGGGAPRTCLPLPRARRASWPTACRERAHGACSRGACLRVESTRSLPLPRSRRCAHTFAPTASRAAHAELSPPIARFLAECCRASDRHARLHPEAVVRVRARCRHAVVYTLYCCCRSIRPTTMRVGGPRFVRARSGATTAAYWPHPSCTERYSSAGLGSVCVRISRVPEQMRNLLEIT